jgi:CRP-like cAMP-binding protein
MDINTVLTEIELFSGLDKETVQYVSSQAKQQIVSKGETVYLQHQPAAHLFVLLKGAVKLVVRNSAGPMDTIDLDRRSPPPKVIGEIAIMDGGPHVSSA